MLQFGEPLSSPDPYLGGLNVSYLGEACEREGHRDGRRVERGGTYSVKVAIRAELEGGGALAADEEELGGAAAVADSVGGWTGGAAEDGVEDAGDDAAVAGPTGAGSTGGMAD